MRGGLEKGQICDILGIYQSYIVTDEYYCT